MSATKKITIARAMAESISQEMRVDPKVFVMGEDIAKLGGVFGNTRGLFDEFGGERIRDTPISETAFIGAGVGAAMDGMRPIVELMFVDFFGVCFDAIYNMMAKKHLLLRRKFNCTNGHNGVDWSGLQRWWTTFTVPLWYICTFTRHESCCP